MYSESISSHMDIVMTLEEYRLMVIRTVSTTDNDKHTLVLTIVLGQLLLSPADFIRQFEP